MRWTYFCSWRSGETTSGGCWPMAARKRTADPTKGSSVLSVLKHGAASHPQNRKPAERTLQKPLASTHRQEYTPPHRRLPMLNGAPPDSPVRDQVVEAQISRWCATGDEASTTCGPVRSLRPASTDEGIPHPPGDAEDPHRTVGWKPSLSSSTIPKTNPGGSFPGRKTHPSLAAGAPK